MNIKLAKEIGIFSTIIFFTACGGGGGGGTTTPPPPVNIAPVAMNVTVTDVDGRDVLADDVLMGSYTYSDAEGNSEGTSTFRWLSDGAAISGATEQNYTLVDADIGHSIQFEVTPIASTGTTTGTSVASDGLSVIEIQNMFLALAIKNVSPVEQDFELWKVDSYGEIALVKDFNPIESSNPEHFTEFNGETYFRARGFEQSVLARTDGTTEGTTSLVAGGINPMGSSLAIPGLVYQGRLYFTATDGVFGRELWSTDGSSAGTAMLKDIRVGNESSHPRSYFEFDSKLYFQAVIANATELWVTDGTFDGTVFVKNIDDSSNNFFRRFTEYGDRFYFSSNGGFTGGEQQLWSSDGTNIGTTLFKELNQTGSSDPSYLTVFNDRLFFSADDGVNAGSLWVSDGTADGTVTITPSGSSLGGVRDLFEFNNLLYFRASDGVTGPELWVTDGTSAGTRLVKDIFTPMTESTPPRNFFVYNQRIYFLANDGDTGAELWVSDGTEAGTVLLKDVRLGSEGSSPRMVGILGDRLYFTVNSDVDSFDELWVTDGTEAGTQAVTKDGFKFAAFYD